MNSIGIFSDDDKNFKLDLHINIKHTKKLKLAKLRQVMKKNIPYSDYLELGLKFKNNIKKVSIFFPCKFDVFNFEDKADELKNSNDLIESLFNRSVIDNKKIDNIHSNIKIKNEEVIFVSLISNNFLLTNVDGGTLLEINTPQNKDLKDKVLYYRFRINKNLTFIDEEIFNNTAIDGYSDSRALISLNINQIRKLPHNIMSQLSDEKILQRTAVFLLTDKNTDMQFLSENTSSLILEYNIWNHYIGVSEENKIIAYRWNINDSEHNKYRLFLKIGHKERKINLFFLILLIILIGALGGIIGNYFTTTVFNNFKHFSQWHDDNQNDCNISTSSYNKYNKFIKI